MSEYSDTLRDLMRQKAALGTEISRLNNRWQECRDANEKDVWLAKLEDAKQRRVTIVDRMNQLEQDTRIQRMWAFVRLVRATIGDEFADRLWKKVDEEWDAPKAPRSVGAAIDMPARSPSVRSRGAA